MVNIDCYGFTYFRCMGGQREVVDFNAEAGVNRAIVCSVSGVMGHDGGRGYLRGE